MLFTKQTLRKLKEKHNKRGSLHSSPISYIIFLSHICDNLIKVNLCRYCLKWGYFVHPHPYKHLTNFRPLTFPIIIRVWRFFLKLVFSKTDNENLRIKSNAIRIWCLATTCHHYQMQMRKDHWWYTENKGVKHNCKCGEQKKFLSSWLVPYIKQIILVSR